MDAITEVMTENQGTINAPDVGFKGFIPAIFARLVNEKFEEKVGAEARVKVTAPEELVRNRKARPDAWENGSAGRQVRARPTGRRDRPISEIVTIDGRTAFRLIVPEYYKASCLSCHGEPKGDDGHHRLPQGRRQGRRSRRRDQRDAFPMTAVPAAAGAPSWKGSPTSCAGRRSPSASARSRALLLIALVVTNLIVIRQMDANAERVIAATDLFEELDAASGANQEFGNLRYWLTDLAVSMLTISERNARAARAELERIPASSSPSTDPALAADIGREADAYMDKALEAVDAYADDNRVVGNTLLAQARAHSIAVQDRLADFGPSSTTRLGRRATAPLRGADDRDPDRDRASSSAWPSSAFCSRSPFSARS